MCVVGETQLPAAPWRLTGLCRGSCCCCTSLVTRCRSAAHSDNYCTTGKTVKCCSKSVDSSRRKVLLRVRRHGSTLYTPKASARHQPTTTYINKPRACDMPQVQPRSSRLHVVILVNCSTVKHGSFIGNQHQGGLKVCFLSYSMVLFANIMLPSVSSSKVAPLTAGK